MGRKLVLISVMAILLTSLLGAAFRIEKVQASGTIYIRADGSIDPPTANITSADNVTYTFIGNINDSIVVERDNIVVDGAGYTVQGMGSGEGFSLSGINNTTIQNTNIKDFSYGIRLDSSSNSSISGNNITINEYGIVLWHSSYCVVSRNNLTQNRRGIYFQDSPNGRIWGNAITSTGNDGAGFILWSSSSSNISGNAFTGNGLDTFGSFGNIVEGNTVNGKPLLYLEEATNQAVVDAGQVILVNCKNITVQNIELFNASIGVQLLGTNSSKIVDNNITANNMYGIRLGGSSNNSIFGNNIADNANGIYLSNSLNNRVYGNKITQNNMEGIELDTSSNNTISRNNISGNNRTGIRLWYSPNNTITENNVTNSKNGIKLLASSNNVLMSNIMSDNTYNFEVWGFDLSRFMNDIDISNTVDGKPIYYWVNVQGMEVPSDAGFVALVNSTNIAVKGLELKDNGEGILLAYTTNSQIANNNISSNEIGIQLYSSSNISVSQNNIKNNLKRDILPGGCGICLEYSSNVLVSQNTITKNWVGTKLLDSLNNVFSQNNITNNYSGIEFYRSSSNNKIFHNNFINNTRRPYSYNLVNTWDYGYPSGGNYWSGHTGVDMKSGFYQNETGRDGIGDTLYVIDENNQDNYPLMGMFSSFNITSEHYIQTICNSTISDFQHNGTAISFDVTGENDTSGFCRICIPKALMNETYRVFVNGTEILPSPELLPFSNGTHSYLYFTYDLSTKEITIIPELSTLIILSLFMIAAFPVALICKRKRSI